MIKMLLLMQIMAVLQKSQNLFSPNKILQASSISTKEPFTMASLQSIFNEFDLDKSGFIDCKQLKEVAKKLGESLSDNDIKELMKGIDSNNDGKISLDEFKEWWVKGHKGKLNDLIILKSKSLKACNQVKEKFKEKGVSLKNFKSTEQKDTGLIRVNFGDNSAELNPQTTGIKFGFMYGANQLKKFSQTSGMKNSFLDESTISLTLKFPSDQPNKLQKAIREVIKEVLDCLAMNFGIEISLSQLQANDYLHVKMQTNEKEKYFLLYIEPGKMVKQLIDQMLQPEEQLNQKLGKEFEAQFEVEFSINSGLKQMLVNNKNLVETLMQGCNLMLHGSVTSSAAKLIKEYFFKYSRDTDAILISLTRNFDLEFKIRTPQKFQEFFTKLGIWQLVSELPSFRDLVDLMAPELQTMKAQSQAGQRDQIPFFTAIRKLIKGLATYCNPGIEIVLGKPNLVVFGFIEGEGLKQLYDIIFPK